MPFNLPYSEGLGKDEEDWEGDPLEIPHPQDMDWYEELDDASG